MFDSLTLLRRKFHNECTPNTYLALDPNPSAMEFHNLLGDCQAQAGSLMFPGMRAIRLPKAFEDRSKLLLGDPYPRIFNLNGQERIVRLTNT